MASSSKAFSLVFLVMSMTFLADARFVWRPRAASTLATRLKLDGESADCWGSLFHLQACSGELIMFFMNGETYLGPQCCQAIRIVGNDCWPGMLQSLGFTGQEGDILQDYCNGDEAHSPPESPASQSAKIVP